MAEGVIEGAAAPDEHWWYPLRQGEILSNHDWVPLYINRLMTSDFVAYACAEGRRGDLGTAILLWCESFKQDPAGTLPDDDVHLAQIARFGADVAGWRAVREGALHGWCGTIIDGAPPNATARLGHPVIAAIADDMHKRKRGRDASRDAGRLASMRSRVKQRIARLGYRKSIVDSAQVLEAVVTFLDRSGLYVTDENVRMALTEGAGVPREVTSIDRRKGGCDGP